MINLETASRDQLLAEIATLQAAKAQRLSCKVTEKGGLSVYGLGRFPVTLYASQWQALVTYIKAGHVDRALTDNAALLTTKG